ncbi:MAG: glycosyltransferase [Ruminococcus sp.]|nr:glycosyltransferase [Ruminococcus sp.]
MNILIFTASTGGGHKRAAAALEAKIHSLSSDCEVTVVDALKQVGKLYDKTVCGGYHFMATKIPQMYGVSYKITDKKNVIYKAVMDSNKMVAKRLLTTINEFKPDVIIACHPFVSSMLSKLKEKKYLGNEKIISLITDYDSHRTYIGKNVDAFVLAEPQMAKKLIKTYDVDPQKIHPLGIPIFDSFTNMDFDKEEICQREGLDPNKQTVLLMAGSFGVTSVLDFYKELALNSKDLQFIVITGNNKKLYKNLEELIDEIGTKDNTKLLFFVDNVYDYMHISDVIVTKPGGLTVTESLACHLPLAIYSAFPGQELDNAIFLTKQNAALLLDKKRGAEEVIELLEDKPRLESMRETCKRLAISDSAENIFRLAQKLICDSEQIEEN